MNSNDFQDWKRHPVTQTVFGQLEVRVKDIQEILGDSAGLNVRQDVLYVGAIQAYNDILRMECEELKEDKE